MTNQRYKTILIVVSCIATLEMKSAPGKGEGGVGEVVKLLIHIMFAKESLHVFNYFASNVAILT